MPNHVLNHITIKSDRTIEILKAIAYDNNENNEKIGTIDFNKIIPMPESLDITSGSTTTNGIEVCLTAINPDTPDYGHPKLDAETFKKLCEMLRKDNFGIAYNTALPEGKMAELDKADNLKEMVELGKTAIHNVMTYGSTTWYEWRIKNWDTKWNSYDVRDMEINGDGSYTIKFCTAWNAPHRVIRELAKKYPDAEITHMWADEDLGSNCGQITYSNGEAQSSWFSTDGEGSNTKEGREKNLRFAATLWGYDPDEEIREHAQWIADEYDDDEEED